MSSTRRLQLFALILACLQAWNAQANSFGFSSPVYSPENGQIAVTLVYDFSDFAMFGGGFDLLYDAGALEFVSFTLAQLPQDITQPGTGTVVEPGIVTYLGLNTQFFLGINSSGNYATIVFDVLSIPAGDPGCAGFELCLVSNPINPFVSLSGEVVDDEVLADAYANVVGVPVPAALWLLASCLAGLAGLRKC